MQQVSSSCHDVQLVGSKRWQIENEKVITQNNPKSQNLDVVLWSQKLLNVRRLELHKINSDSITRYQQVVFRCINVKP
jgi:hypothetical protein